MYAQTHIPMPYDSQSRAQSNLLSSSLPNSLGDQVLFLYKNGRYLRPHMAPENDVVYKAPLTFWAESQN